MKIRFAMILSVILCLAILGILTLTAKEMDAARIAQYGILSLLGLVVDGVLKVSGKVLKAGKIRELIQ